MYYLCSPRITYKILIFMTHHKNSSLSAPGCVSRRLLSVALLVFLLCITGCKGSSKDSDDEDDKDSKSKSELIVGFWEQDTETGRDINYMAFHEDGTVLTDKKTSYGYDDSDKCEIEMEICCALLNWSIKGKQLTIEDQDSQETSVYTIRKLNEKTMVLVDEASEEELTFRRISEAQYKRITGEPTTLEGRRNQFKEEIVEDTVTEAIEVAAEPEESTAPAQKGYAEMPAPRPATPVVKEAERPAPQPKVEPAPQTKPMPAEDKVFQAVEQPASFPGGTGAMNRWLANNLAYPESAQQNDVEGKVIVQFIVEKDGSISSPKVARGVDADLDREALRVVKRMPRWTPAHNNGVAVRSQFTLPVVFRLTH